MTYATEEQRLAAIKESRRRSYLKNRKLKPKEEWKKRPKEEWTREKQLLSSSKWRATEKCLEHDIVLEDILIPEVCPILGIPLSRSNTKTANDSPSLDRIDPTKGYVKGNVHVISWRANKLKGDATLEESFLLYQYYKKMSENSS